jgi:hypothetical protein
MPAVDQFYETLKRALAPSFLIQGRGSINAPIRSSSTFGPQINTGTFNRFQHSQNPKLAKQLNGMNK